MAKIRIAQNPTFKALVSIPIVGGEPEKIEFTFKYRDRPGLAALFDEWNLKRDEARAALGESPTLSEIVAADTEQQSQQIKDLVVGWGFDDKFEDKSIRALVTSCQGAAEAVVNAYQSAFNQARLGN
ncbi:phage tail assembly chaperone [Pseudomonas sp. D4002]|uniref:phage tail assembly chaperone n=1 Tax=Pseudomonas sp. D4002 TaxID=2738817 RepID=UPI0015A0AE87|nr:phage tail assembly chaperone [Pseudomonas sp. D4002]NWB20078.1 phage tail assembly chaperone [Pseudomonas sp. D4002]